MRYQIIETGELVYYIELLNQLHFNQLAISNSLVLENGKIRKGIAKVNLWHIDRLISIYNINLVQDPSI